MRVVTREEVLDALQRVIDPELGVDIVNLGLVYSVEVFEETATVLVDMTLTAPGCPLGDSLTMAAEQVIGAMPGVKRAKVNLVWHPPWDPTMMTALGRARLGIR